jgi:hypothetical protein
VSLRMQSQRSASSSHQFPPVSTPPCTMAERRFGKPKLRLPSQRQRRAALVENPPPLPPSGDVLDPEVLLGTLRLSVTRAKKHATDWRSRANQFPAGSSEWQRSHEAAKRWERVSVVLTTRRVANEALAASLPELVAGAAPAIRFDVRETDIIVKPWGKRKTQAGDAQVTAW